MDTAALPQLLPRRVEKTHPLDALEALVTTPANLPQETGTANVFRLHKQGINYKSLSFTFSPSRHVNKSYKCRLTLISQSVPAACLGTLHLSRNYEVGSCSSRCTNHNKPLIPEGSPPTGVNLILHSKAVHKACLFRFIYLWSSYANSTKYHIPDTFYLTNFLWAS